MFDCCLFSHSNLHKHGLCASEGSELRSPRCDSTAIADRRRHGILAFQPRLQYSCMWSSHKPLSCNPKAHSPHHTVARCTNATQMHPVSKSDRCPGLSLTSSGMGRSSLHADKPAAVSSWTWSARDFAMSRGLRKSINSFPFKMGQKNSQYISPTCHATPCDPHSLFRPSTPCSSQRSWDVEGRAFFPLKSVPFSRTPRLPVRPAPPSPRQHIAVRRSFVRAAQRRDDGRSVRPVDRNRSAFAHTCLVIVVTEQASKGGN